MSPLLLEILSEDLPPASVSMLAESFARSISTALHVAGLIDQADDYICIATPRRIGLYCPAVRTQGHPKKWQEKLLPAALAFNAEGSATAVLDKKIAAVNQKFNTHYQSSDCILQDDGKTSYVYLPIHQDGQTPSDLLSKIFADAISSLPVAKWMEYQLDNGQTVRYVRPVRSVLALYGNQIIPLNLCGIQADRITSGHRFMSAQNLSISHASEYFGILQQHFVEPQLLLRREKIVSDLTKAAAQESLGVVCPDDLIDEVCALVEWPTLYAGAFDQEFLQVPQECLILTMQKNQKYFASTDKNGNLTTRFWLISNIATPTPENIVHGNERVIRARLADAAFFFSQDKKISLDNWLEKLGPTIYQQKLGNQAARVGRLVALAEALVPILSLDGKVLSRAAHLAKADLATNMVSEFPALQGTMGGYYAFTEGEVIARAIGEHYRPRFAQDDVPQTIYGSALALIDKLEALVGFWGVGIRPTGERDPLGLRRHAIGIMRLLLEKPIPLDLCQAIQLTSAQFSQVPNFSLQQQELINFFIERLRFYFTEKSIPAGVVDAVLTPLSQRPVILLHNLPTQLSAIQEFPNRDEASSLIAAHKRMNNLLKKTTLTPPYQVLPALFRENIENVLWQKFNALLPSLENNLSTQNYDVYLQNLSTLSVPIDQYFNDVMVMSEDLALRTNRLHFLHQIREAFNGIADFSLLPS